MASRDSGEIAKQLVSAIISDPRIVDELLAAINARGSVELIAMPKVLQIAGISRSELWRRVANGTFPKPCRIGDRCTRWSRSECEQWAAERLAERAKSGSESSDQGRFSSTSTATP